MTSPKTVSWSALVNLGNDESLGLTVTGEATNPDEARDIFAFACGQLLGVANSADAATAALVRAYVSRLVTEEEAKPAVRDEKEPTVRLEAPPAKEPWIPKITKSSWEKAQAEKASRTLATAKLDAGPQPSVTLDQVSPLPERMPATSTVKTPAATAPKTPTIAEQTAAAVAQCIKPPTAAPEPAPSAPPTPEASAPAAAVTAPLAPKTTPPEGFSLCAECGEAVPANQAKLSQLFQSKTLCKKCFGGGA